MNEEKHKIHKVTVTTMSGLAIVDDDEQKTLHRMKNLERPDFLF